ncbi:MAG: 4-alpha-glucanotransferase [Gammaproteobacteria bacterium]|nr:MAG: 4-alpha-glucanotransferase [Gammaproteobacteria bacterium]
MKVISVPPPAILDQRRAGILLHPTSLPGPFHGGDIGHDAYRFVEFLAAAGCSVWQMLPLGPTHEDGSPYQCLSVHAANPMLISLHWLVDRGWLDFSVIKAETTTTEFRRECLVFAFHAFQQKADADWQQRLVAFKQKEQEWLHDYALFMAIKHDQHGKSWTEWPDEYRLREPQALKQAETIFSQRIAQTEFEQFIFFTQWHELRDYARHHKVYMFGDMPIFVSPDSADVWASRENFLIDANGVSTHVAGVPPDAFSDVGQRWGNPLYDWQHMQQDQFSWWKMRFKTQLELFDLIRIDHFRGLEACWQIPAEEPTAINGAWIKTPGKELLQQLYATFDHLALVAEDLGLITPEVIQLRQAFDLPGMKVLQFAFDGDKANLYLPYNHEIMSVVYSGTHDNDTTLGWYHNLSEYSRQQLHDYLGQVPAQPEEICWLMSRMALSSVAKLAVLTMQDILQLDGNHRMNVPGTTEGNWVWRYQWDWMPHHLTGKLRHLIETYGRLPKS